MTESRWRKRSRKIKGGREKEIKRVSKSIADSVLVLAGEDGEKRGPFMWRLSQ